MIREPYTKDSCAPWLSAVGATSCRSPSTSGGGRAPGTSTASKLNAIGADIPDDVRVATYTVPGAWDSPTADPHYRWAYSGSPSPEGTSLDARIQLPDWRDLDAYLAEFPDISRQAGAFDAARAVVQRHPNQYVLGHWWYCFYERLWAIRGMQNVLLDFIEHPAELKRLSQAILDHHVKVIRAFAAAGVDGIFTSDDLGSQRALMMSPAAFRRVLKPLYAELFAECHSLGLHFWLHACGNIQSILGDLIDIGLDVIHPIQAHTMDYQEIVDRFGGKITFLVGLDVQHLLPQGTEAEVRAGVRDVARVFRRPEGGFMLAAGNGIMPETPLGNIRAFLEESSRL